MPESDDLPHPFGPYEYVVVYQNVSTLLGTQPLRNWEEVLHFVTKTLPPGTAWKIYGSEGSAFSV